MSNNNSFELVFCFVFNSFLNCVCFKLFCIFKMRHLKKVATGGVHEKRWSFAKFTGKYLCRSRPESLLKKRLQKRYFTVIFTKSSFEPPIFWVFLLTYPMFIWLTLHLFFCMSFSSNLPNVYLVHFASVFVLLIDW